MLLTVIRLRINVCSFKPITPYTTKKWISATPNQAVIPLLRRRRRYPEPANAWFVRLIIEKSYLFLPAIRSRAKYKPALSPNWGAGRRPYVHKYLAERALAAARESSAAGTPLTLWYTGGRWQQMRTWVNSDILLAEQLGNGLGQRMAAPSTPPGSGTERAVLIGTDCPALDARLIVRALDHLHTRDLVIGPAHDGGYYLHRITPNTKTNGPCCSAILPGAPPTPSARPWSGRTGPDCQP